MTEPQGDPSKDQPIEGRDWSKSTVPQRQCVAHKKNGDQCKNAAILGGTVCKFHGGAVKHVRNAARVRLQNAADRMAKELLNMATSDDVSDAVKLAALRDALDRAGLGVRAGLDVEITAKPFEQIISRVESGSRAEYRASIGQPEPIAPALADRAQPNDDGTIDAEIVEPNSGEDLIAAMAYGHVNGEHQADTHGYDDHPRDRRTAAQTGQPGGLTLEEANAEALRLRRNAPPMRPPAGLRALPPGRSSQ